MGNTLIMEVNTVLPCWIEKLMEHENFEVVVVASPKQLIVKDELGSHGRGSHTMQIVVTTYSLQLNGTNAKIAPFLVEYTQTSES